MVAWVKAMLTITMLKLAWGWLQIESRLGVAEDEGGGLSSGRGQHLQSPAPSNLRTLLSTILIFEPALKLSVTSVLASCSSLEQVILVGEEHLVNNHLSYIQEFPSA